ncbi:hypothetical protein FocTR4_00000841 [Fusarium oxysporum f. sp. cubense]|nr:hypothetical protein FocTR4_00000841 [Fusarium oxysporum f. sp. cubense]
MSGPSAAGVGVRLRGRSRPGVFKLQLASTRAGGNGVPVTTMPTGEGNVYLKRTLLEDLKSGDRHLCRFSKEMPLFYVSLAFLNSLKFVFSGGLCLSRQLEHECGVVRLGVVISRRCKAGKVS